MQNARGQPLKLATEISSRLAFSFQPDIDEFTLSRWRYSMEDLRAKGSLDSEDYTALSKIYFVQGRYAEFESLLVEGVDKWKSLSLVSDLMIGSLMLSTNGKHKAPPSAILKNWFDHPLNDKCVPLNLTALVDEVEVAGRDFKLVKSTTVAVALMYDGVSKLKMGPLVSDVATAILEGYDFFFGEVLLDDYSTRIASDFLAPDHVDYLKDILSDSGYVSLQEHLRNVMQLSPEEEAADALLVREAAATYAEHGLDSFVSHHELSESNG